MTTRLLRLLPVAAALALAFATAESAEPSIVAGAILALGAAALALAVLTTAIPVSARPGASLRALRPPRDGQPAPAHPGTPGRVRARAPGRGSSAASS